MDALHDPSTCREDTDVEFSEAETTDGRDAFDYFDGVSGLVAVGVTNDAGAVLLMESPHGWRLPYGAVESEADRLATAETIGETLTGVPVTADRVERVTQITHRLRTDEAQTAVSYDAAVGTEPIDGDPVADDPTFGEWEDLKLGWFDAVPDDAYHAHGSATDDIERFVE